MMIDFVFWTVFWWIVGVMVRNLAKMPKKFDILPIDIPLERLIVEHQTNLISLFHAIFLISISFHSLLVNPWIVDRPWTEVELMAIRSSFCYFIYDTIFGIIYRYNDKWMNLHHIVILLTYCGFLNS